jgi:hypothetical protein
VEEVVTMKLAAENYRNKKTALLDHVGKQLVVQWTEEDSDLSFKEWSSDLRIGVVTKFVAHTHEFMLRFKCGYEKLIPDHELVLLYDASESFRQNKKVKVKKQVRKAEEEWADKGTAPAERDLAAQLLLVEEQLANAQKVKETLAQNLVAKLAKEKEAILAYQRKCVLQMQQFEAAAARTRQEDELARLQKDQEEAAAIVRDQIQLARTQLDKAAQEETAGNSHLLPNKLQAQIPMEKSAPQPLLVDQATITAQQLHDADQARITARQLLEVEAARAKVLQEEEEARVTAQQLLEVEAARAKVLVEEENARIRAEQLREEEAARAKVLQEEEVARVTAQQLLEVEAARATLLREEEQARITAQQLCDEVAARAKLLLEEEQARVTAKQVLDDEAARAALLLQEEQARVTAEKLRADEVARARLILEEEQARITAQQLREEEAARARLILEEVQAKIKAQQLLDQEGARAKLLEDEQQAILKAQQDREKEAARARLILEEEQARVTAQLLREEEAARAKVLLEEEQARVKAQQVREEEPVRARLIHQEEQERVTAQQLRETEAARAKLLLEEDQARVTAQQTDVVEEDRNEANQQLEDKARQNEEREGIIRGNYPVQDLNKSIDYLRKHGMGRSYLAGKELPDILPTFYLDGTTKNYPMHKKQHTHLPVEARNVVQLDEENDTCVDNDEHDEDDNDSGNMTKKNDFDQQHATKQCNESTGSRPSVAPSPPAPTVAPEHILAMFQGIFQQQQQQQQQQIMQLQAMQAQSGGIRKRKHADDSSANKQKKFNGDSDENSSDSDEDVKVVEHTPNTARRILWQRGHGSLLPSTVRGIIAEATVRTMAEARVPLQQLGFAIIEDMTEVYAPKNRCTKEQRDFIQKCKSASDP